MSQRISIMTSCMRESKNYIITIKRKPVGIFVHDLVATDGYAFPSCCVNVASW